MKCFYRITLKDGKVVPSYVPKALEKTDQDMFYFDYFAYACRDEETFYNQVKKLNGIEGEIEKVTIDYKRDKNTKLFSPYSIEFGNPYLKKIFEFENGKYKCIKRGKARVLGTNVFDENVVLVDKNSDAYLEMKDYVFNYLQNDPDKFFKSIYNKNNDYSVIMKQYAELYKMNEAGAQEEILIKERDIADHLAKYQTFRSVAVARYRYDRKQEKKANKQKEKEDNEEKKRLAKQEKDILKAEEILQKEGKLDQEPKFKTTEDLAREYNEKTGESVTAEEYKEMANGEKVIL